MNILSISGILPVPGYLKINDFVFEFYDHYLREFNDNNVFFVLPVKYTNPFIKRLLKDNANDIKLNKLRKYHYNRFSVEIITFFSAQRFRNLHALLSYSVFSWNRKKIDHIIKQNKIDVVHAQYIFPDGLLAYCLWKKYKIPYIITSHNELKYFGHYFSRKTALKIFINAYRITPINYLNYSEFLKYGLNNILHIPLGFESRFLKIEKKKRDEEVNIITIASLIKLKNIDKVILALARIDKTCKFHYSIVGEGPEKEKLISLIKQHNLEDRITFMGNVPHDQIGECLSEHDIFIMPSYFETFGRVYFEAMAVKLPIICAKNSGIYGFFKEMQEGISVDHTNIDEIAGKLELLIVNKALREKIGLNGHLLVKNFTWEKLVVQYQNIYSNSIRLIE